VLYCLRLQVIDILIFLLNLLIFLEYFIFELGNLFFGICSFFSNNYDSFFLRYLYLISKLRENTFYCFSVGSISIDKLRNLLRYSPIKRFDIIKLYFFRDHDSDHLLSIAERSQLCLQFYHVLNDSNELLIIIFITYWREVVILNYFVHNPLKVN